MPLSVLKTSTSCNLEKHKKEPPFIHDFWVISNNDQNIHNYKEQRKVWKWSTLRICQHHIPTWNEVTPHEYWWLVKLLWATARSQYASKAALMHSEGCNIVTSIKPTINEWRLDNVFSNLIKLNKEVLNFQYLLKRSICY